MFRKIKQFFCKHKDSELIDLVSHDGSTGTTICWWECRSCGKEYEK